MNRMKKKKQPEKVFDFERGLQEDEALDAARKCLRLKDCSSCQLCSLLCPELCITRNHETGQVRIDMDYCKGCGICASICPKRAIKMVLEEGL
jgi:2-oxoacid:acceptor oxidoreductase delta subunit (pyruvate/2-ketoisovalerate family)